MLREVAASSPSRHCDPCVSRGKQSSKSRPSSFLRKQESRTTLSCCAKSQHPAPPSLRPLRKQGEAIQQVTSPRHSCESRNPEPPCHTARSRSIQPLRHCDPCVSRGKQSRKSCTPRHSCASRNPEPIRPKPPRHTARSRSIQPLRHCDPCVSRGKQSRKSCTPRHSCASRNPEPIRPKPPRHTARSRSIQPLPSLRPLRKQGEAIQQVTPPVIPAKAGIQNHPVMLRGVAASRKYQ